MPNSDPRSSRPTGDLPGSLLRLSDILVALGLILVLTPIIALVAALSYRPNLPLIQRRRAASGAGGHLTVYEFNARDECTGPAKPRGRGLNPRGLVRIFRGDQLPQLVNVIRGELSFFASRSRPRLFAD